MPYNWIEPRVSDVSAFMRSIVIDRASEQSEEQVQFLLTTVVQRVRGTIAAAGVVPVSAGEGEVPPEGVQHTIVLTVHNLLNAAPNFAFLMRGADGSETGLGYAVRRAEAWLQKISEGTAVTYPTNVSGTSGSGLVRWGSDPLVVTTAT